MRYDLIFDSRHKFKEHKAMLAFILDARQFMQLSFDQTILRVLPHNQTNWNGNSLSYLGKNKGVICTTSDLDPFLEV